MPKTNKKRTAEVQTKHFGFFIDEKGKTQKSTCNLKF